MEGGLELIEIAPGIDLERDVIAQTDVKPAVSPSYPATDGMDGMHQVMVVVPVDA